MNEENSHSKITAEILLEYIRELIADQNDQELKK